MHLCMTNNDIRAIIQISINPKFEIKDFLNELQNEWNDESMNAFIKFTMT